MTLYKYRLDRFKRNILLAFLGVGLLLVFFLVLTPEKVLADSLQHTLQVDSGLHILWRKLLAVVNSLVILVLIAVAFAEILRLNINTYGIKKMLPTLVMAIVASNFSWIVCRLLVDLSYVARTIFMENGGLLPSYITKVEWDTNKFQNMFAGIAIFLSWITRTIYDLLVFIALLLLWLLFWIRNWVIMTLSVVSPIAFMAMVLPQTKSFFSRWWQEMLRWTFMPVASYALLWLGGQFMEMGIHPFYAALVGLACIYGAVMVPFWLGGQVMALVGGAIGTPKAWLGVGWKTLGEKTWQPAWKEIRDAFETKRLATQDEEGGFRGGWQRGGLWGAIKGASGYIVRRGERIKFRRSEQERAVQGKLDSAFRAAFGGKNGQFEDELAKYTNKLPESKRTVKAKHINPDGTVTETEEVLSGKDYIAYRTDSINGDFGEKDWIQKHNMNEWMLNTASGQSAADRATQYRKRLGTADMQAKVIQMVSEMYADNWIPGISNRYHDDITYGYGDMDDPRRRHFSLMHMENAGWENIMLLDERIAKKFRNDAPRQDRNNAGRLSRMAMDYRDIEEYLNDNQDSLSEVEVQWAKERMGELALGYKNMLQTLKDKGLFNERTQRYEGGLALVNEVACGGQTGTFSDDIRRARTYLEIMRTSDDPATEAMLRSRMTKEFSESGKQEETSEAGKRDSIGSVDKDIELFDNPTVGAERYFNYLNGIVTNLPEGHNMDEIHAVLKNMSRVLSSPMNVDFLTILEHLVNERIAPAAQQANGNRTREWLAASVKHGIEEGLSNSRFSESVRKEIIEQAVKSRTQERNLSKEEHEKEANRLRGLTNRELDGETMGALVEGLVKKLKASKNVDLSGQELNISFNELTGQVEYNIDETALHSGTQADIKARVEGLREQIMQLASGDVRNTENSGFVKGVSRGLMEKNRDSKQEMGVSVDEQAIDDADHKLPDGKTITQKARSYKRKKRRGET